MNDVGRESPVIAIRESIREDLSATLRSVAFTTRLIDLVGDPGAGKTFLVGELVQEAKNLGVPVLSARCSTATRDIPYLPFVNALASLTEIPPAAANLLARLSETEEVPRPVPGGELLGSARRLLRAWPDTGLLIVIDDFHLADEGSLDLLTFLLQWPATTKITAVLARRPRPLSPRKRAFLNNCLESGLGTKVALDALSVAQSGRLLGVPADDPALPELHRLAHGNPLYLRTLAGLRADSAADVVETEFGSRLLGEFIDLNADELAVAEAAAVAGDRFDVDTLVAVAQLDRAGVCTAAGSLLNKDILRRSAEARELVFRHPLVSEVFHAQAEPYWRVTAHRRMAEMLKRRGAAAVVVAPHIEAAGLTVTRPGDVKILVAAAEDVLPSAPASAARWLTASLRYCAEHPETATSAGAPERIDLLVALARALEAAGEVRQAQEILREIRAQIMAAPGSVPVTVVAFCAKVLTLFGRHTEALEMLDATVSATDPARQADVLLILLAKAVVRFLNGDLPVCVELDEIDRLARATGDLAAQVTGFALRCLSQVWHCEADRAAASLAECARLAAAVPDSAFAAHADCFAILGWAEAVLSRPARAERHFARGISVAGKHGVNYLKPVLLAGLCYAYQDLGCFLVADRVIDEASELLLRGGHEPPAVLITALAARNAVIVRRFRQRQDGFLDDEDVHPRRPRNSLWGRIAALCLADRALLTGDPELGAALILRAGGGVELLDLPPSLRPCCFQTLAEASACASVPGDRWAESAAESAGETIPHQQAFVITARGHIARGRGDAQTAGRLYQEAAALFSTAKMTGAQVRLLLGAALSTIEAGDLDQAAVLLNLAKQLARECGAALFYDEAEQHGRSLVRRPIGQTLPEQGLSELTGREREVARLIATTGMRTREVAEQLGVSPRTVDVHLTRIYRKLNITSRTALAAMVARH